MKLEQGNNLPRVKAGNRSAILRMIYYSAPVSRREIADCLELTLPTITTNVNAMIAEGIVRETRVTTSARMETGYGRKAHLLEIVPEARHFIGIEMTGFRCFVSVVDYRGREISEYHDTENCADYDENMRKIGRYAGLCLKRSGLSWDQIQGVCFGLPGVVDREAGVLKVHPRNQWNNKLIERDFRRLNGFGGQVVVENNACVRALGAQLYWKEELESAKRFAYLFVDRGIACPLIINSSNFTGSVVGAGEVGHMVMEPDGLQCSCGNYGCLEAYSSDHAVIRQCREKLSCGQAVILSRICGGGSPSMSEILEAQRQCDMDVTGIVEKAVYTLGVALANIINFCSPDVVLIECKLFELECNRLLLESVAKRNLCNKTYQGTRLIFVKPDYAAGAKGAAAVAIDNSLERSDRLDKKGTGKSLA